MHAHAVPQMTHTCRAAPHLTHDGLRVPDRLAHQLQRRLQLGGARLVPDHPDRRRAPTAGVGVVAPAPVAPVLRPHLGARPDSGRQRAVVGRVRGQQRLQDAPAHSLYEALTTYPNMASTTLLWHRLS
eukprot:6685546-Prymnesium_polylepis.1